jgi:hypothetical protein
MSQIPGFGIPGLDLSSFQNLINNELADITRPFRLAPIDRKYHWVSIGQTPNATAAIQTDALIRAHYAHMGIIAITAENARRAGFNQLPVNPGTPNAAHPATVWVAENPSIRREAIVLGAIRAAAIQWWRFNRADINPDETIDFVSPADQEIGLNTTTHDADAATLTLSEQLTLNMPALTELEIEICYTMSKVAIAAVPFAGMSLIKNGHHYLNSDTRATTAVMNQLASKMTDAAKIWFATNSGPLAGSYVAQVYASSECENSQTESNICESRSQDLSC